MKHIIEVHNQSGIKSYTINSFADAALSGDWNYEQFDNIESMQEIFGDDEMPENWKKASQMTFPIVHVYTDCGSIDKFMPADKFDVESEASDYLAMDLSQLIVIENKEDAEFYATKYNGHEYLKVRRKSEEILEEMNSHTCPCCGHKLGGWTNAASAENGKKGGRPRKDGMNIHNYQTIMHISFDDNKFIELDFDGVFDVYGDKEEYATAEEAESAFDADYLEELLEKAHESGVELTQDQIDQIMRRMVQWRDRIGDYF